MACDISVPNIVNVGHFTLIKVRRNSGELKNLPFLVGQSYHLRIAKTQGFSGWNYSAPPMTHREAQNVPKTFNRDKIHQYKAFWSTLEPFIHPWESQNDHFLPKKASYRVASGVRKIIDYYFFYHIIDELSTNYRLFNTLSTNFIDFYILPSNRPGTWLSTQLDFPLRSLLISECGLMKKLKWGSVYLFFYKFFVLCGSSWWLCIKNLENIKKYRLFGKILAI